MKTQHFASLALVAALAALGSTVAGAQTSAPAASPTEPVPGSFTTRKEAISYAIGVTTVRNLVKDGVEIDTAIVLRGMQDALAGGRTAISEKDIKSIMTSLVTEMRQKMAANRHDAEGINKKKGDEYRASFAKQSNVVSLPNGLLYKAEKTGSGPRPTDEDAVIVKYRGRLIDGKEFDGTPEDKSTTLKLDKLIVGWKEALKLMPTGSKWSIVVPPNLAYGVRGVGADIGPNETLVFDVELMGITKPIAD
jgi:FKBP-type peptidyl-prolyl cis-trans isomerase FklB